MPGRSLPAMRDLVVREALQTMARDAAKRFRALVAEGKEIPYDVHESGDGSPLPQYAPLTGRFIREHAPLLRELDSFGSACAAIESAELAASTSRSSARHVPPDAGAAAPRLAGVVFLCRLWEDSTDFSLDDARLTAAIAELEANGDADRGEIEVVVPLRGLRMETHAPRARDRDRSSAPTPSRCPPRRAPRRPRAAPAGSRPSSPSRASAASRRRARRGTERGRRRAPAPSRPSAA